MGTMEWKGRQQDCRREVWSTGRCGQASGALGLKCYRYVLTPCTCLQAAAQPGSRLRLCHRPVCHVLSGWVVALFAALRRLQLSLMLDNPRSKCL